MSKQHQATGLPPIFGGKINRYTPGSDRNGSYSQQTPQEVVTMKCLLQIQEKERVLFATCSLSQED